MGHVCRFDTADRLWTVGFYNPQGVWFAVADAETSEEAWRLVNFLNGGTGLTSEEIRFILLRLEVKRV